jgi:predicted RNase H-like HicB family nuclease
MKPGKRAGHGLRIVPCAALSIIREVHPIEPPNSQPPKRRPSIMVPLYPTEVWSNVPAFQHVSEECEFWSTHTLVDCGDEVCAEPLDYGEGEIGAMSPIDNMAMSETESSMSMDGIYFAIRGRRGDYIAYPIGVEGVVVGQGATFEEALESVKAATRFHIETFGRDLLRPAEFQPDSPPDR